MSARSTVSPQTNYMVLGDFLIATFWAFPADLGKLRARSIRPEKLHNFFALLKSLNRNFSGLFCTPRKIPSCVAKIKIETHEKKHAI